VLRLEAALIHTDKGRAIEVRLSEDDAQGATVLSSFLLDRQMLRAVLEVDLAREPEENG